MICHIFALRPRAVCSRPPRPLGRVLARPRVGARARVSVACPCGRGRVPARGKPVEPLREPPGGRRAHLPAPHRGALRTRARGVRRNATRDRPRGRLAGHVRGVPGRDAGRRARGCAPGRALGERLRGLLPELRAGEHARRADLRCAVCRRAGRTRAAGGGRSLGYVRVAPRARVALWPDLHRAGDPAPRDGRRPGRGAQPRPPARRFCRV